MATADRSAHVDQRQTDPTDYHHVSWLLRRISWIAAIALAGMAATAIGLYLALVRTERVATRSREVSRVAREARALATDRETGVRGFLLTGDSRSLAHETMVREPLRSKLDSLLALTAEDSSQQRRARVIRDALDRWDREFAAPAIAPVRPGSRTPELAGARLFDAVRDAFTQFTAGEEALYRAGTRRVRVIGRSGLVLLLLELIAVMAMLAWLRHRVMAQTLLLEAQRQALAEQATKLEGQTIELREQAAQLQEQAVELELQTTEAHTMSDELENANQQLGGALATAQEARSAAEGAVREQQETLSLLDSVLSSASIGFALVDRDFRHVRINEALAAFTGIPPADHIGRTVREIIGPVADTVEGILRRVLDTGEPVVNVELVTPPPDPQSRPRHVIASYYPIRRGSRPPTGVGIVVIDTTEQKELEQQLAQSQKMEAIGRLAGGVAHDFNNLLTVIKSYSTMLLEGLEPADPHREDVEEIANASDRAAALTRQLLAFSRKQMMQPRAISLNAVVTDVEKMLRRLIGEDVALVTTLDPDLWLVSADPGQVEQVIMNLAVNARDAMPEGGRLAIETANVELAAGTDDRWLGAAAGAYVMLAVSDTGTGMTADVRQHLFEPFFTTKERGKGTGLGLSTVYGIVKQSGGDVWVYSEPDQGATFKVYLPRLLDATTPGAVTALHPAPVARGTETILLVEDDAALRTLAERILRSYGYTVLVANNGPRAINLVARYAGAIDLVATDVVMPEMSGSALVERLGELRPGVRVLFMSGYTDDEVTRRGILDRRAAFLQKPFAPEQFAIKVREVLDDGLTHRASA